MQNSKCFFWPVEFNNAFHFYSNHFIYYEENIIYIMLSAPPHQQPIRHAKNKLEEETECQKHWILSDLSAYLTDIYCIRIDRKNQKHEISMSFEIPGENTDVAFREIKYNLYKLSRCFI